MKLFQTLFKNLLDECNVLTFQEESTAIRNDIEIINEHIELWKSVEELEKKKEDLLSSLHNEPSKVIEESMSSESDLDEFDIDSIDWRAKRIT